VFLITYRGLSCVLCITTPLARQWCGCLVMWVHFWNNLSEETWSSTSVCICLKNSSNVLHNDSFIRFLIVLILIRVMLQYFRNYKLYVAGNYFRNDRLYVAGTCHSLLHFYFLWNCMQDCANKKHRKHLVYCCFNCVLDRSYWLKTAKTVSYL